MKETMTVTALRQMHRRGASKMALERIAGGAHQLHYLDKKYYITRPRPAPPPVAETDPETARQFYLDGMVHMTGR